MRRFGVRSSSTTRSERKCGKRKGNRGPANAQAFELTLDDLSAPKLRPVAFDRKQDKNLFEPSEEGEEDPKKESPEPDAIRNESLRIVKDLIELGNQTKTASIPKDPL
jgi:hypothetical protein